MNLLLLNLIIVYIWDVLNIPNLLTNWCVELISKGKYTATLKPPFGCSFCLIFWISFILMIISYPFLPAVAIALLNAYLSKITLYIFTIIDNLVDRFFCWLETLINK